METWKIDLILLPFYIVVVVSGVVGNSLFITVVKKRRSMHTTTNFLLANVAVSDVISLIFCVPGIVLRFYEHPGGSLGNFLCKFVTMHLVAGITLLVSGLTLTLIAVERHSALLRPMESRLKLAKRRVATAICIIWGISIALVFPLFIEQKYVKEVKDCHMDWSKTSSRVYWVFLATVVGISLLILPFCYFRIVRALYLENILPATSNHSPEQDARDKSKIIKLLITVTVLFFICFFPFIIVSAVNISTKGVLYKFSCLLVYSSCSVNPVVFLFQSANYRTGLKDLWNKRSFRQRERSLES